MNSDDPSSIPPHLRDALRAEFLRRGLDVPATAEEVTAFEANLPSDFDSIEVPEAPSILISGTIAMAARKGGEISADTQTKLAQLLREMRDKPNPEP